MSLQEIKKQSILALIFVLIGAAIGYLGMPTKVITKTEIKEVVKEVEKKQQSKQNDKKVTIIEKTNPDGSKTKETIIVDKGKTDKTTEKDTDKTTEKKEEKIVENSGKWLAKAYVAHQFGADAKNSINGFYIVGVGVERKLLGPFSLGVFGLTNNIVGLSIGMGF